MRITAFVFATLLFTACVAPSQYRVVVPGTGSKTAFIAENPTIGTNGSCFTARTTDPTTHVLHDDGRLCGAFDATGYANARMTIQTVTGDSVFQNNTTWKALGMITGDTSGPSWYTPPDTFIDVASSGNQAHAVIDGNTGAQLIFREGNFSAGNKVWDIIVGPNGGQSTMFFRMTDDTHSSPVSWLRVTRSGTATTQVSLPETVTTRILLPEADNTYTVGTSAASYSQVYATVFNVGRGSALQGVFNIFNTTNSSAVTIAGTNANVGIDVGIGNLIGSASSMYPLNGSVDLGGTSHRWRKIWVSDIDISGTCTGCVSGAAAQDLSNLTNPTAINQSLLFNADNTYNIGGTNEVASISTRAITLGKASAAGQENIYNASNANPQIITGVSVSGSSVDLQIGNPFTAGSIYGLSNVTLGNGTNPWSTIYGNNFNFAGSSGGTTVLNVRNSAGSGTCTITFSVGGFISSTC